MAEQWAHLFHVFLLLLVSYNWLSGLRAWQISASMVLYTSYGKCWSSFIKWLCRCWLLPCETKIWRENWTSTRYSDAPCAVTVLVCYKSSLNKFLSSRTACAGDHPKKHAFQHNYNFDGCMIRIQKENVSQTYCLTFSIMFQTELSLWKRFSKHGMMNTALTDFTSNYRYSSFWHAT